MIERIKDFHSKLDVSNYRGQEKVHLLVCSICFGVYTEPDVLREHFIKVGHGGGGEKNSQKRTFCRRIWLAAVTPSLGTQLG